MAASLKWATHVKAHVENRSTIPTVLMTLAPESLPADFALAWAWHGGSEATPSVTFVEGEWAASPIALGHDDVVCWLGTLAPSTDVAAFAAATLSETERRHVAALRQHHDAVAYAAAHAALRRLLANVLRRAPEAVAFGTGPHGKPFLRAASGAPDDAVRFSISHAAGLAAVAVARRDVGIDVERMAWSDDLLDVAPSTFADEQVAALQALAGMPRCRLFFRYWTLGEALIKATGLGLSQDLKGFVFNRRDPPALLRGDQHTGAAGNWHFGCYGPDLLP